MNRIVRVRELTFEEFLKREEIDTSDVLLGDAYSDAVAKLTIGRPGFTTRRTGGSTRILAKKMVKTQGLYKWYLLKVPEVLKEIPLGPH